MTFVEGKRRGSCAIYFDYQKFQKVFRTCDDDNRVLVLIHIVAHEMRHYYQYRQITSKKPKEDERIVQEWIDNKIIRNNSNKEFLWIMKEHHK